MFQIKPDKADINLEIESLTEWRHLYAEAVKIDGFNNLQSLEMNYYPPIEIHLHGCAVDGVPYSVTDSLLIQGNNSDKHQEIAVSISGKFDYVFFQDVTCNVDVWSFAPRTVELSLIGPQEVQLRNCHASIVDRNGRIIHEFGEAELITMTSGDAPYTPDGIQGLLTSGKISSDEASKYIDEYKNGIFTIGIKKTPEECYLPPIAFPSDMEATLSATWISHFSALLSGSLSVVYSPTPQEYKIKKQNLEVKNNIGFSPLSLEYDFETETGNLWGYISEGQLSDVSLFPSFRSWYFSSGLIAPVTIITAVISAITLFNKKKEQKGKNKNEDK